jgi:hypothetical protein
MTDTCVCGGSRARPNPDCERCELIAEVERLNAALYLAITDIHQWTQLARYQREVMDQNLGWCPTQAGLDASKDTLDRITMALRAGGAS